MMRTTLTLPDDVYEVARALAAARQISIGDAVADLVRRGLTATSRLDATSAFPRFSVPDDAPPITLESTLAAEDDL